MTARTIIGLAVAAALGALGVMCWLSWRRGREAHAGVLGPLSPPTLAVLAIASLGVSYHAAAHALALPTLKAPMWIAALVGFAAAAMALLVERWERRSDAREGGEGGG